MTQSEIDMALYNKYIAPTKKNRKRCIGIEIEMPVVNRKGMAVDEHICIEVAKNFRQKFGFEPNGRDDNGEIYSMIHRGNGDDLSFDCAYSNLEISLGKGENLYKIKQRFEQYYLFLNDAFSKYDYTLTGMGINPHYNINHNQPIPNERYRMLYHHLHTYKAYENNPEMSFCNRADFGTFTSASQVQIDVDYENLVDIINVFGGLEPYKALLFGNSYIEEYPDYMIARNMLWEHSMQGYNPHNIGMYDKKLESVEDLLSYIKTTSIYCVMRNGKYVNFKPVPIDEYLKQEKVVGEYYDGEQYIPITIRPCIDDLEHLRSFKFEDLTFRGTIEFRSTCCQPISDSMTVAAFHIGLMEEIEKLKILLKTDNVIYNHGYTATELQKMLSMRELPEFIEKEALKKQLMTILDLATEGLAVRGYGEEKLLDSLYRRAEKLTNPAKEMVQGLEHGKNMMDYILEYGCVS
ncbi:MAG: hypothetical protein ACI4GW_01220 [Lachnospiraceae bacterium]